MNGPEHYTKAEALTENAWRRIADNPLADYLHAEETRALLLDTAQVHATLALVAATVAERVTAPANSPDVLLSDVTEDWSVTR